MNERELEGSVLFIYLGENMDESGFNKYFWCEYRYFYTPLISSALLYILRSQGICRPYMVSYIYMGIC